MSNKKAGAKGAIKGAAKKASQTIRGRGGVFATLAKEHGVVSVLINKLQKTDLHTLSERQELLQALNEELLSHAEAEDATLYGALEDHPDTADLIRRFRTAHADMEAALLELANLPAGDDGLFDRKVAGFKKIVESHIDEEENELFPLAADILSDERERALLIAYEARRGNVRRRLERTPPESPHAPL